MAADQNVQIRLVVELIDSLRWINLFVFLSLKRVQFDASIQISFKKGKIVVKRDGIVQLKMFMVVLVHKMSLSER